MHGNIHSFVLPLSLLYYYLSLPPSLSVFLKLIDIQPSKDGGFKGTVPADAFNSPLDGATAELGTLSRGRGRRSLRVEHRQLVDLATRQVADGNCKEQAEESSNRRYIHIGRRRGGEGGREDLLLSVLPSFSCQLWFLFLFSLIALPFPYFFGRHRKSSWPQRTNDAILQNTTVRSSA